MNFECRVLTRDDKKFLHTYNRIFVTRLKDSFPYYPHECLAYIYSQHSVPNLKKMIGEENRLHGHFSKTSLNGILIFSQEREVGTIDWLMARRSGSGVGSQLLDYIINSPPPGIDSLELSVSTENIGAQRLYIKKGFEIIEHIDDENWMRLDLN